MPLSNLYSGMTGGGSGAGYPLRVDESTSLLDRIFEYSQVMEVLTGDRAEAGGVIPEILGIFSSFAAAGVALVMVYMWSVAVMHTAWEGEALGQRFSTLWTPIRSVMAVVFVAPFPGLGGLSVMMAIILALVGTSIQGANTVYGSVLGYFEDNGGTILPRVMDDAYPDDNMLNTAILGEACMNYYNDVTGAVRRNGPQAVYQGQEYLSRSLKTPVIDGRNTVVVQYGNGREGQKVCGEIRV